MFDLLEYTEIVKRLANCRNGQVFVNSGPQHAAVVVENMLDSANKTIAVYSGSLDKRVHKANIYDRAISRIGAKNIRVVVADSEEPVNEDLISYLKEQGVEVNRFQAMNTHFMVVDGDSYRLEHDRSKMKAIFAFGDTNGAKSVANSFEAIWNKCTVSA